MTRTAALFAFLSIPAHDWGIFWSALVLGVLLGVILLGLALRKAIENEIGRWFGWCVVICIVALVANAQRIPGRRVPIPTEMHTIDASEWRYADGTSRYTNPKSELRCTASDGHEYTTTTRDENLAFVFVTPAGVHFEECPRPSTIAQDTVRVAIPYGRPWAAPPDPQTIAALDRNRDVVMYNGKLWMIVLAADMKKAAAEGYTREVWPFDIFVSPPAPTGPPSRRRGVIPPAPPLNLHIGEELHSMPGAAVLNALATLFPPGTYIVITDGKVWFIRERQGLPVILPFRQVWP